MSRHSIHIFFAFHIFAANALTLVAGCAAPVPGDPSDPAAPNEQAPDRHAFVLPMHDATLGGASAPANAHLTYYGGPVIQNVKVVAVFWGANVNATVKSAIAGFYAAVTNSTYMDWLSEYDTNLAAAGGGPGTHQSIGRGTFAGAYTIAPANGAAALQDTDVVTELDAQIAAGHLPAPDDNTVYMIDLPPGTTATIHGASGPQTSCTPNSFCAYHSTFVRNGQNVIFGVVPDQSPGSGCDTGCGADPVMLNNFTSVSAHELIESVTNPAAGIAPNLAPPLSWWDNAHGMEIGDLCNTSQGTFTAADGTVYTVQKEWSNAYGACVAAGAGPLVNGGFETGTLAGWSVDNGSASAVGGAHSGAHAAQVGSTAAFNGDSTLTQTISVPASGTTTLSFWYQPHTADTIQYDQQQAQLRNVAGATLATLLNECSNSGAWTHVTADLTPYKGTSVVLWFNDHDDGYAGDPTYYLLDDVTVTSSALPADTTSPTVAVTAPANGATVSGTVAITVSASDNVGVTKVELYVDGTLFATGNTAAATVNWNTASAANGAHTLLAKAWDAAGNVGTSAAVKVTVSNGAAITPHNVIVNGGFEGTLNPWTLGGVQNPLLSTVRKHTGNNSLRCGANGSGEPNGDSFAYQNVAIPANATRATLTFWYLPYTTDTIQYDWQDAQLRSSTGATLVDIFHLCSNSQAWTQQTVDVTAYKGQTVQVWFNAHGDGASDPTTLWVDDVSLTVQ